MKENELLMRILKINKIIMILLIFILIVLTLGVSKMYSNEDAISTKESETTTTESEYNTNYDVSMFTEIKASDIKNKTKKETQIIYIGRETCSWCAAFLPSLWQAQEEFGYKTLYIDLAKIIDFSSGNVTDQDSFDILNKLTGTGYEKYMEENFGATPMVLIIKNNKIIGASTGYSEYETFVDVLKEAGIK